MSRLLVSRMFGHQVTVEVYTGRTAAGPAYAAGVVEACRINDGRRFATSPDRAEVLAETVIYMRAEAVCPAGSRITMPDGRTVTVVRSVPRNGGIRPTPKHLEVAVQ